MEGLLLGRTTYLWYTRQTNDVRQPADDGYEHFFPSSEEMRPLVDDRRDETLHCAKLGVQPDQQQHEEEQTGPERRSWQLENGWRVG